MSSVRPARLFRTESFRLTILLAGLFVGAVLLLTTAMFLVTESALNTDFITSVRGNIGAVDEAYRNEGLPEAIEIVLQLTAGPGNDYYLLQDASGARLAGNLPAMTPVFALSTVPPPPDVPDPRSHMVLGEGKTLPDGSYLFVGADSHQLLEARRHILIALIVITTLTIAVALAGGTLLSAGALRRTDAIIEVCRAIAAEDWNRRIAVSSAGTESDLLAATINKMLDKLTALMENVRQVSTEIAHDLRMPLTHMRQRLERAQMEARTPAEYAQVMERALADSDNLLSIFSALLSLAQIEAGIGSKAGPVDLTGLLEQLAETYRPVAEDHGHTLSTDLAPGVTIAGDRTLLMQMFTNLIENAIRHCPRGAKIDVRLAKQGEHIAAEVADTGPGIPQAEHDRIFQRFSRAEANRPATGHGLGLALVAAIAKRHGIGITLGDNAPGLVVRLSPFRPA